MKYQVNFCAKTHENNMLFSNENYGCYGYMNPLNCT